MRGCDISGELWNLKSRHTESSVSRIKAFVSRDIA